MKTYFIGFLKQDEKTVIVQMRTSVDFLSPQLWKYFGERINTKKRVKAQKIALLEEINKSYNTKFTKIKID